MAERLTLMIATTRPLYLIDNYFFYRYCPQLQNAERPTAVGAALFAVARR